MAGYDYIEFATGGALLQERLPIIFFFHSRGSGPDSLAKFLEGISGRARVVMPWGRESLGSGPIWWELRAKSLDQAGLAVMMDLEARSMVSFIKEVNRCLKGVGKPIIIGHSQGGMMTMAVAAEDPNLVKAAIPVAGWLPVDIWPQTLPPMYAVHGTSDKTVNYSRTESFIEQMEHSGMPVELYPIPNHGHSLSGEMRSTWWSLLNGYWHHE